MSALQRQSWSAAAQQQSPWRANRWMFLLGAALLVLAALWPAATPPRTARLASVPASDPVIALSSDVQIQSSLSTTNAVATSDLALSMAPDAAWLAGDEANDATAAEYNTYPSHWGRLYSVLDVVPGSHDASGSYAAYESYFGTHGTPYQRAENVGAWRVYFLDSDLPLGVGSATYNWLQSDLAAHPNQPIAAVWHHPRWSTDSVHGDDTRSAALWSLLYSAHADLVIDGHAHGYQRWAQLTADGVPDASGLREFIVATGGRSGYSWARADSRVEYRQDTDLGVMRLVLHATSYDWQFRSTSGVIMDQGSDSTHNTGAPDTTPPAAPTGLSATVGDGAIALSWIANAEADLAGYRVYRANADGSWPTSPLNSTLLTSPGYTDSGLANGTGYIYRVIAVDISGNESLPSATVSATPAPPADTTPPTVPTGLRATAVSATRIDLTWTASTDNVAVAFYRIYRDGSLVGSTTGPVTRFSDTGLRAGTRYSYQVSAVDAAGLASGRSKTVTVRTKAR